MCPAEKNPRKLGCGGPAGHFLQSVFDGETCAIAAISRFSEERSGVSLQSRLRGAGRSLALTILRLKFPATRRKIQGICEILPPKIALLLSKSHILREKPTITCKSEQD
jgi:hypothetical protein